jgi:Protein of unknown function (DUF3071)
MGVNMDDLSLVGVHDDGEHLLVAGPGGQRYRLRVDDALRAAVRRDRARLSQLQLESEGRLRPKEIQARIRAGETARDVAASAGLPLEHVQRYEGPVLAEREYIADQARQVRVQRGGAGGTLGDVVAERLAQRDLDPEHLTWDAWRGDDGTWTVALGFHAGSDPRQARWTFNTTIRHVSPQDDEARWLSEEEPTEPASTPGQRRLASVRERVFDVEARGGVTEEPAAVDLLDTLRERRGRRNRPLTEDEELAGAPDPVREAIDSLLSRTEAMHEPSASHPARQRADLREPPKDGGEASREAKPQPQPRDSKAREAAKAREARAREAKAREAKAREARAREATARENRDGPARESNSVVILPDTAEQLEIDADSGDAPVAVTATPGPNRKQRRASVPSWDDIVFGQRRD